MSKLILKTGDVFTSTAPALAHGVNVDGLMTGGIAPYFRDKFPVMHDQYLRHCESGDLQAGGFFYWPAGIDGDKHVFNLASQDRPGPSARLEWLHTALDGALAQADEEGIETIAMPRIGCGVGGLDWVDVEPVIAGLAAKYSCNVEVWAF